MRKLLVAIAALGLTGSAFSTDLLGLKNLKVDGSLEVLGNQAENETDANDAINDKRGNTVTRVRLGVDMDVTSDVTARIEAVRNPENGNTWGRADQSQYGTSGRATTANDELDKWRLHNAYVDLAGILGLDNIRLGRQYLGRMNDAIVYVGPMNDDALSVGSADALAVTSKFGPVNAEFVTGKAQENADVPGSGSDTDATNPGDINITWLRLASDELVPAGDLKFPLELGYYSETMNNGTAANDNVNISIIDLRAGIVAMEGKLSANLEYAMNGGQDNNGGTPIDLKGNAILADVAFNDADLGLGLKANYINASGDDDPLDTEYKGFQAIASDTRYGEILSRSNTFGFGPGVDAGGPLGLNVIGLGASYTAPIMEKKLSGMLDYYMAKFNETGAGPDDIGNEIDLALQYAHSETVTMKAGYAMLMPGEGLVGMGNPDDDITKLWAKLDLKWGK